MQRVTELPQFPPRPDEGHKGTFGRVLVVAGSRGMSGAACLAGLGALRGGAGLVYVAAPEGILPIVAGVEPSYLTIPLPEDADGRIDLSARDRLEEAIANSDVVAIGPGWGRSAGLDELAVWMFRTVEKPVVVDADALNALAANLPSLAGRGAGGGDAPRILTPHPGEFACLCGKAIDEVQRDREDLAVKFAADNRVLLVLKGRGSIVTDGERIYVNSTGNPGMATGGTGDVLTGLIAALLAQGLEPFDAAQLGVYLHGLAGDLAAAELSQPGLIASDLPRYLGQAISTSAAHVRP